MLSLVLTAVTLILLYAVPYYWLKLSRGARLTAQIPGPKFYPIIGNVHLLGNNTVSVLNNLGRLWKQYGNIYKMWFGPKLFIIIADPKYIEPILSSTTNITKNISYKFTEPWLGKGLLTSTGSKWKHHRRIITPTFHFKILEEYLEVFNSQGNVLIDILKKRVGEGEFDIYNDITICALEIICESAMGVYMDLQNNSDSEYVKAVKGLSDIVMKRTIKPWLHSDFIFNMSSLGKLQKKYLEILHNTTNEVIKKKKLLMAEIDKFESPVNEYGQKKRIAFLDLLLQYNKGGANLTDQEICEEVDTFMFEGHDTTASGISFILWALAKHQDVQEKVYAELCEIFRDSDRKATVEDLQNMKYLELVIKEASRIYPSVPLIARELDEDVEIDNVIFSSGTNILIQPFFAHRNSKYFPDPEKFNPDRFLPEVAQGRHPYAYVPFSAGPRNCIGQKFAMMEMKSVVYKIIRNFRVLPGSKDIVLAAELVLRSAVGIIVNLENRKGN